MPDATEVLERRGLRPAIPFARDRLLVPHAQPSSDAVVAGYLRAVRTMTPAPAAAPERAGAIAGGRQA